MGTSGLLRTPPPTPVPIPSHRQLKNFNGEVLVNIYYREGNSRKRVFWGPCSGKDSILMQILVSFDGPLPQTPENGGCICTGSDRGGPRGRFPVVERTCCSRPLSSASDGPYPQVFPWLLMSYSGIWIFFKGHLKRCTEKS